MSAAPHPRGPAGAPPILRSALLDGLDWVEHGFGTRHAALDQAGMVSLEQIHSNRVLVAGAGPGCRGEADALVTSAGGATLSIRTADCYPILLADPVTRTIAAVHAGWRGTAGRIVERAIETMRTERGARPADVWAAIGPGIGVCCYRVGAEVAARFGVPEAEAGDQFLDLGRENRKQLETAGVPAEQIEGVSGCTACEPERFYSWRRDRERAGRMISFIAIRP